MEIQRSIKIVYKDDGVVKVIRGILLKDDVHTYSVDINGTIVDIGKSNLVKATQQDEG